MGTMLRVLAVLVLVLVAASIGTAVYNAGVSAGLAEAAVQAAASGDPAPYVGWAGYGPYAHGPWGFGFFGILFGILFLFLVIGLVRAAFFGGRGGRGGRGGWDGRGGWGGPGGWEGRRERLEELHRELHRNDPEAGSSPATGA